MDLPRKLVRHDSIDERCQFGFLERPAGEQGGRFDKSLDERALANIVFVKMGAFELLPFNCCDEISG